MTIDRYKERDFLSKNDIIAEYVKQYHPEILATTDFAIFNLHMVVTDFARAFQKAIKQVGVEKVKELAVNVETKIRIYIL